MKAKTFLSLLLILISTQMFAQHFTIHGNIRNKINQEILPSITVMEKGGNARTISDEKGNFAIQLNW